MQTKFCTVKKGIAIPVPQTIAPADYSDMQIDAVRKQFALELARESLFPHIEPIEPSAWLTETLHKGLELSLISEKARSEFLVAPILLELRELCQSRISIYSGVRFDVDPDSGLRGVCDFILSRAPAVPTVQAPVVMIVEAKKNDVEAGLGQCIGEMVAARIFNQREQNAISTVYGCVTTGEDWQFLSLQESLVRIGRTKLFISNVELILGTLKQMVDGEVNSD